MPPMNGEGQDARKILSMTRFQNRFGPRWSFFGHGCFWQIFARLTDADEVG